MEEQQIEVEVVLANTHALLPQRAHVPPLHPAHLGVKVAGQRVLDRQERMDVRPAQLS